MPIDTFRPEVPRIIENLCGFLVEIRKTLNLEAIHEALGLFTILTQKYPDLAVDYIEQTFVMELSLEPEVKKEIVPVIKMLMAVMEDQRITSRITDFTSNLIFEMHSPYMSKDVILNEEALRLMLVYFRRLQNYSMDRPNPFQLTKNMLSISESILEKMNFDEEEMLNIFLVLEEMHFSLPQADFSQISEEYVMDIYMGVFKTIFSYAEKYENAYMILLICYYAATLTISNNNSHILQVACHVRDKVKEDIVQKLVENKETPDEHHRHYFNGYLTLFGCLAINENNVSSNGDFELCKLSESMGKEKEIEFFKILTEVGQEYMQGVEGKFFS